jgi:hypothetical protein
VVSVTDLYVSILGFLDQIVISTSTLKSVVQKTKITSMTFLPKILVCTVLQDIKSYGNSNKKPNTDLAPDSNTELIKAEAFPVTGSGGL